MRLVNLLILFENLNHHRSVKVFNDLAFIQCREKGAVPGAKIIRLVEGVAYLRNGGFVKLVNRNIAL